MNGVRPQTRKVIVTFFVAGAAAVIAEHILKPKAKRRLGV